MNNKNDKNKDYFKFWDRNQFVAKFAYDGSKFFGVQAQPGLPTVLGALRTRIEESCNEKAKALAVAARTDRGVHALENYATFFIKGKLEKETLIKKVVSPRNDGLLDVSLWSVSPNVHARQNSRGKTYRYFIKDGVVDGIELLNTSNYWVIAPKLDINKMKEAASMMLGEQDFSSFRAAGCQAGSVVKNISKIEITRECGGRILIEISGNAFLRKMIRIIVGLLSEIGAGLREPDCVPVILAHKNRRFAGITAPPHGLCLAQVHFVIEDDELR